jgi:hypothetical protein
MFEDNNPSYMSMVSHVAIRTQVRPRTESERKLRYKDRLAVYLAKSDCKSTYIQPLFLSEPSHVGLIMFVAVLKWKLLFGDI